MLKTTMFSAQIRTVNVPCIKCDKAGNNMKISIKNYFSTIFSSKIDALSGNLLSWNLALVTLTFTSSDIIPMRNYC